MNQYLTKKEVDEAFEIVRKKIDFPVQAGIVLGSGLGPFADTIEKAVTIPFSEIPNFPESTVAGHSGKMVAGFINGVSVLAMQGRVHYYEGHHISRTSMGIRIMAELGIRRVILTNAAGSVNADYVPGDYMILTDHINLLGVNPLVGPNEDQWGERFVDQSNVYSRKLREYAEKAAGANNLTGIRHGVYAAMSGPTYETPAEIRMLRAIGVDAVGMSTVPEAIAARHSGMDVLGISLITNYGAGISMEPPDHSDVMNIAQRKSKEFQAWVTGIIKQIDEE